MTAREPQSLLEHITANIRPQPAIPAVAVMFLFVLLPALSAQGAGSDWQFWLVPAGLVASAGLAVAAGFCSLAPHAVWVLLGVWSGNLLARADFPGWVFAVLYLCLGVTAAMFFMQLWRIRTRRFVPTIRDQDSEWSGDKE